MPLSDLTEEELVSEIRRYDGHLKWLRKDFCDREKSLCEGIGSLEAELARRKATSESVKSSQQDV